MSKCFWRKELGENLYSVIRLVFSAFQKQRGTASVSLLIGNLWQTMSVKAFHSSYTKTSTEISVVWMLLQFRWVKILIKLQNPIGCSCNCFQCEDHTALRFLCISTTLPHTLSNFVRSCRFQPITTRAGRGERAEKSHTFKQCLSHICQLCFLCPLCARGTVSAALEQELRCYPFALPVTHSPCIFTVHSQPESIHPC